MLKVQIAKLRDNVSSYVRRAEKGETIHIFNRNREVAVLAPCSSPRKKRATLLGYLKGTAVIRGDIVRPVIPPGKWFRS